MKVVSIGEFIDSLEPLQPIIWQYLDKRYSKHNNNHTSPNKSHGVTNSDFAALPVIYIIIRGSL